MDNNGGKSKKTYKPQTENTTICLVHASWCGHCQALMPEWEKFMENMKPYKHITIITIEDSQSDKDKKLNQFNKKITNGEKFQVNGFPSIGCVSRGKLYNYNGERSSDKIKEWVLRLPQTGGKSTKLKERKSKKSIKNRTRKVAIKLNLFNLFGK